MTTKPIIFQGAMVRALLDGTKTQTRRAVKPQPEWRDVAGLFPSWVFFGDTLYPNGADLVLSRCPYGPPGTLLWVMETWSVYGAFAAHRTGRVYYRADNERQPQGFYWHPSKRMPRWASRLTLLVTDVRVERVCDIREADAKAEGIQSWIESHQGTGLYHPNGNLKGYPVTAFGRLWDSINAAKGYGWSENPWVWVIEFRTIHANIDAVLADPAAYGVQQDEVPA